MKPIPAGDAVLEVSDQGAGDPVVFVQTALTADELLPLAQHPALAGCRRVLYHRRGYAGSSTAHGPGSIVRDAADCHGLMRALDIERAHVVGLSYSGAVALQLAADIPSAVQTLTLIEPPPVHTASAPAFRAANARLVETRRVSGAAAALEEFLTLVIGPRWRETVEGQLPGAAEQMEHDVASFFDTDLPALLAWQFGPVDAAQVACPVLYVGGTESGQFFDEVHALMLSWLAQAEDILIAGADHGLALTHTQEVAQALAAFVRRHPLAS